MKDTITITHTADDGQCNEATIVFNDGWDAIADGVHHLTANKTPRPNRPLAHEIAVVLRAFLIQSAVDCVTQKSEQALKAASFCSIE